jgi:ABC-type oligopeptide transport system substrate-binding subunit
MKKKIVSALLCVAMAASLVVGCGSKSGSDSGSSKGGDKLVYWAMWSEDEPQAKLSASMKKILVLRLMYSSRDVPDRERDLSRL